LLYATAERFSSPVFSIDGRVDKRQKIIDKFSSVKGFSVMILNPTTAGMGLNITSANHIIHYSRQWNPALEEQATARAYRNKQSKEVNVYYMFYANTIEEKIDERLRKKKQLSDRIISAVDDKDDDMDTMLKYIKELGD
jgi:SNF2 family DNA or RNA helicase